MNFIEKLSFIRPMTKIVKESLIGSAFANLDFITPTCEKYLCLQRSRLVRSEWSIDKDAVKSSEYQKLFGIQIKFEIRNMSTRHVIIQILALVTILSLNVWYSGLLQ